MNYEVVVFFFSPDLNVRYEAVVFFFIPGSFFGMSPLAFSHQGDLTIFMVEENSGIIAIVDDHEHKYKW